MCARRIVGLVGVGVLLPALVGCNIVSGMTYLFGPPRIQEKQFELAEGRLAVLLETARPEEENPEFTRAFHRELRRVFEEEEDILATPVPLNEVYALRQGQPDFGRWSLQKVGQALKARQVLYGRIERLQIYEGESRLLLRPRVRMHVKLIGADEAAATARLWPGPEHREGWLVEVERPHREADDVTVLDAEAAKLGRETARKVAEPFYDVRLEDQPPPER